MMKRLYDWWILYRLHRAFSNEAGYAAEALAWQSVITAQIQKNKLIPLIVYEHCAVAIRKQAYAQMMMQHLFNVIDSRKISS